MLIGCDQEHIHCPYGQCLDEYSGLCVPCGGYGSPVVQPPVVIGQPIWEPIPGQGLIYLHTGESINIGPAAMLNEYGQMVFVYIGPQVFGQASMLAENERDMNPQFPRPLLVTYGNVIQPIQTGFGPVHRTVISFSICIMCAW